MTYMTQDKYGETMPDRERMAMDLAAAIGGTIERAEPGNYGHSWIACEGFTIGLYRQHGAKVARVRISAFGPHELSSKLPTYSRGPVAWPEITVSAERTPEQIAADVSRRILPQAREAFAALAAKVDGITAKHSSAAEKADALRNAAPSIRLTTPADVNGRFELYASGEGYSVSGHMRQDGGLYLERVSVPAEMAAAVLALLTTPARS